MKFPVQFLFFLLLCASCNLRPKVTISGTTEDVPSGVVSITDAKGETIAASRINNDRFDIKQPYIQRPGFYTLVLAADQRPAKRFMLYLETENYEIRFARDRDYPVITTTSKIQNEISSFYDILEGLKRDNKQRRATLKANLNIKANAINPEEFNDALNRLANEETEASLVNVTALQDFIKQYPDNNVAARLMAEILYENSPETYYKVCNQFNAYNKETSQGKQINEKLSQLLKLKEGALAPEIAGFTPQGRKIDLKRLNTRLTLVEFWRAGSSSSRKNHQIMLAAPFDPSGKNLSIVGVNFDTKRDWWLTSVKDDKIGWTQVSDLKGNDSPNAKNWAITTIPTYYLLDREGRIIEREIPFSSIKDKVYAYLAARRD